MDGYVIGLAVGIGAGIAIGISIGKKQKNWSELNQRERRFRIGIIAALSALVVVGAVAFLLRLYS